MTDTAIRPSAAPVAATTANIMAKSGLVVLLTVALLFPELGHMRDKAAELRAIGYPLASFVLPVGWWLHWRDRVSFPWLPDLLVTMTCFTDILGNRMNLYETVVWFDDWMHVMNVGLLASAVVLLTLPPTASLLRTVELSVAFGATAGIAWEVAEFLAFISRFPGHAEAYADTLADLVLGLVGALVAAVVVHWWRRSRQSDEAVRARG